MAGGGARPWLLARGQPRRRVLVPTAVVGDGLDVRLCHANGGGRSSSMCCLVGGGVVDAAVWLPRVAGALLPFGEASMGRRDSGVGRCWTARGPASCPDFGASGVLDESLSDGDVIGAAFPAGGVAYLPSVDVYG